MENMENMRSKLEVNQENNNKVILLTGNTGYIGTVMTKLLRSQSYFVLGFDTGWFSENRFFSLDKYSLPNRQITKDIRRVADEDLKGVSAVIHLAALSNDPLGELNPHLTDEINYNSTVRLAQLCKKNGVQRFIFASSCSIYGRASTDTPIEESGVLNPITAYAKAKVNSELQLEKLSCDVFHTIIMRNATVYGCSPRLRLDLVVNNLLAWAYLTGEIIITSDGTPWRPLMHIEDFCSAFMAALEAPAKKSHCQVFNVGINEENYQVKEIAYAIQEFLPKSKVKITNETGSDERSYRVDFSKVKAALPGFRPQWNLKKGIRQLLEAYKKYNLTLDDFNSDRYFRIRTMKALIASGKIDKQFQS